MRRNEWREKKSKKSYIRKNSKKEVNGIPDAVVGIAKYLVDATICTSGLSNNLFER